jgi:hypothetical protein
LVAVLFSIPRVNVIESDEGFSVEVLGQTGLRYVEGQRSLFVDSEVLAAPNAMALYPASIRRWDRPHDGPTIDDATKHRIVENIRRAFRFRGLEIDVLGE